MLTKKNDTVYNIRDSITFFSRDSFNIGKILIKLCIEYLEVNIWNVRIVEKPITLHITNYIAFYHVVILKR